MTIDMNPTTDNFHVPERAITRSNTKKIQVSNQENNGVADWKVIRRLAICN